VDACLSLENLIDPHSEFIERRQRRSGRCWRGDEEEPRSRCQAQEQELHGALHQPALFLQEQKARLAERAKRKRKLPEEPQRDVLHFLIEHAPLENWERDVLSIVREEAYYFAPQAMTKVMNEGWPASGTPRSCTQRALADSEVVDFADHHSGTLAMSRARSTYKIGIELFREIEER